MNQTWTNNQVKQNIVKKKFIFDETDDRFLQEAFFNLFL